MKAIYLLYVCLLRHKVIWNLKIELIDIIKVKQIHMLLIRTNISIKKFIVLILINNSLFSGLEIHIILTLRKINSFNLLDRLRIKVASEYHSINRIISWYENNCIKF